MLRCSATRAMTRTLHEPWPKPKRPPSARDPPSQSAAPQKTAESISRKPYHPSPRDSRWRRKVGDDAAFRTGARRAGVEPQPMMRLALAVVDRSVWGRGEILRAEPGFQQLHLLDHA